eukprot:TRINITY_DN40669_c0_g1_i2.p1 TRINITY_DN40669_c0_g1~~TRINITY_DN40669_c0_g1_i2.p1  ORF type:complete len:893 (-),score=221.19 TRINITY_DN40669_c0_g1_i2:164-2842(-)
MAPASSNMGGTTLPSLQAATQGISGSKAASARGQAPPTFLPPQPASARLNQTNRSGFGIASGPLSGHELHLDDEVFSAEEDDVREMYRKHAGRMFEEMREGFLREVVALRQEASKSLRKGVGAAAAGPPPDAYKVEQLQQEVRALSRLMQSESGAAHKAVLTPLWKERALKEIAQGELKAVCVGEVEKAFSSFGTNVIEKEVESVLQKMQAAGEGPWEQPIQRASEAMRTASMDAMSTLSAMKTALQKQADDVLRRLEQLEGRYDAFAATSQGVDARIGQQLAVASGVRDGLLKDVERLRAQMTEDSEKQSEALRAIKVFTSAAKEVADNAHLRIDAAQHQMEQRLAKGLTAASVEAETMAKETSEAAQRLEAELRRLCDVRIHECARIAEAKAADLERLLQTKTGDLEQLLQKRSEEIRQTCSQAFEAHKMAYQKTEGELRVLCHATAERTSASCVELKKFGDKLVGDIKAADTAVLEAAIAKAKELDGAMRSLRADMQKELRQTQDIFTVKIGACSRAEENLGRSIELAVEELKGSLSAIDGKLSDCQKTVEESGHQSRKAQLQADKAVSDAGRALAQVSNLEAASKAGAQVAANAVEAASRGEAASREHVVGLQALDNRTLLLSNRVEQLLDMLATAQSSIQSAHQDFMAIVPRLNVVESQVRMGVDDAKSFVDVNAQQQAARITALEDLARSVNSKVQELSAKFSVTDNEATHTKSELRNLQSSILDSSTHRESALQQQTTRLAALEGQANWLGSQFKELLDACAATAADAKRARADLQAVSSDVSRVSSQTWETSKRLESVGEKICAVQTVSQHAQAEIRAISSRVEDVGSAARSALDSVKSLQVSLCVVRMILVMNTASACRICNDLTAVRRFVKLGETCRLLPCQ